MASATRSKLEERKKIMVANLYRYSDLSIDAIAHQVDAEVDTVQDIVDELIKDDALDLMVNYSTTNVGKIMTPKVITIDCSKTAREAAALMAENLIGSIVVTKGGKPFGIVTHSDIVRWVGLRPKLLDASLEGQASRPLITVEAGASVEHAARIMIKNEIHKLPIVDYIGNLAGIVTITDLAIFLSPSRRPGLAHSLFQAISRGKMLQQ